MYTGMVSLEQSINGGEMRRREEQFEWAAWKQGREEEEVKRKREREREEEVKMKLVCGGGGRG